MHPLVLTAGHQGERGERLALRAGAQHQRLLRRQRAEILDRDQQVHRHPQVAEIAGHPNVAEHAAAYQGDLAAELVGVVEDLLHAVHVAGEAGHHHAMLGGRENLAEGPSDLDLGGDVAGLVSVGRIRQQQVDALTSPPRSVGRESIGVRSNLKSPVWTIVPARIRNATAIPSGIECDTAKNSRSKGPSETRSPGRTSTREGLRLYSSSFADSMPSDSRVPYTGTSKSRRK